MKLKLLFPFLLFCGMASAQIANIPDGLFKTALLNATNNSVAVTLHSGEGEIIDTNNDGQIQVSEAANVKGIVGLHTVPGLTSIEGIKAFTNLISLNFSQANLASLDISNMTSLLAVSLGNVSGTANLSGCSNVVYLGYTDVSIGNLDLSGMSGLTGTFINWTEMLDVDGYINFSGCSNLTKIDLATLNLTSINLTGCTSLKEFIDYGDTITTINFSTCSALEKIEMYVGMLTSITLGTHLFLKDVYIEAAMLDNVHFTGCPNLRKLTIAENKMNTLDLSQCSLLDELYLDMDQFFQYLNLKNGDSNYLAFGIQIASAAYVCIDEGEESYFTGSSANPQCLKTTYCTFQPGGNYNGITGSLKLDLNNNGCDAGDLPMKFVKMKRNNGTADSYTFSNAIGKYNFYVPAGNYTINPVFDDNWYTATPASAAVNFANNNNNNTTKDFCVVANGVHPDVEVVVMPIGIANPGFDADYKIVYRNKGNQMLSGNITFTYDDGVLDFVSALPSISSSGTGSLNWNYTNLLPFEDRAIAVKLNLNGPMETPPANNGDVLNFSVTAPVTADESPANNTFALTQTVTGSYDPNDIVCLEGALLPPNSIGSYLHYVVNFENTGTASATFVVVKLTINPADFDVNTLQMMNSTHPVYVRMNGNVVEFMFDAINLYAGDHGNILFKLKSKSNLVAGDNVVNNANIYFDYNWPVQTNDANSVFQLLSTGDFDKDDSVSVYPNPSKSLVNVKANSGVKSIELYDVQGRLLQSSISDSIDVSHRASGMYFLKVKTEKGVKVEKLVRE